MVAAVTSVVSINEVLAHLDITEAPSDGGTKLQGYVSAAMAMIEDLFGTITTMAVTETHDGGDAAIFLRQPPLLSVTSLVEVIGITPYNLTLQPVGSPTDNFGFSIDDYEYGMITRRSAGSQRFPFYANTGNITVTYQAGLLGATPANLRLGLLELVRHLWQVGQQGITASFGALEDEPGGQVRVSDGFAVPYRVREILGTSGRGLPAIG